MRGRWRDDDFGAEPTGHLYLHVERPRLVVGGAPNPEGHSDRRHLADPLGGLSSRTAPPEFSGHVERDSAMANGNRAVVFANLRDMRVESLDFPKLEMPNGALGS